MNLFFVLALLFSAGIAIIAPACTASCEPQSGIPPIGPPQIGVIYFAEDSLSSECRTAFFEGVIPDLAFSVHITIDVVAPSTGQPGFFSDTTYVRDLYSMSNGFNVKLPSTGMYSIKTRVNVISLTDQCYSCDCCADKCSVDPFYSFGTVSYYVLSQDHQYETVCTIELLFDRCSCCVN